MNTRVSGRAPWSARVPSFIVGGDGIEEAATAAPGPAAAATLEQAIVASKESKLVVEFSIVDGLGDNLPRTSGWAAGMRPWVLGEAIAQKVRQAAHLTDGPIRAAAFSNLIGAPKSSLMQSPAAARRLPYGARLRLHDRETHIALKSADARDRRFEIACALGDAIWRAAEFGVVSKAKTDRQKFQRAFAQNLLIPYADLREHVDLHDPSEDQISGAAKRYHVHPNVVRRLLVLRGALRPETMEEQLEAA